MKAKHTLLIVFVLVMGVAACKKSLVETTSVPFDPTSIRGKWAIVTDSTYTGVGLANHPVNYTGLPGDYFDFRNDSLVYTKEGPVLNTLHYKFISDTSMIIGGFGIILNGQAETTKIDRFTAHELFITARSIATPGGVFGRKVRLSR